MTATFLLLTILLNNINLCSTFSLPLGWKLESSWGEVLRIQLKLVLSGWWGDAQTVNKMREEGMTQSQNLTHLREMNFKILNTICECCKVQINCVWATLIPATQPCLRNSYLFMFKLTLHSVFHLSAKLCIDMISDWGWSPLHNS